MHPTDSSTHLDPVAAWQVRWVLLSTLAQRETPFAKHSKALLGGSTTLTLAGGTEVTLTHRPLSLEARVGGKPVLRFNGEGLLNYEHRREKQVSPASTCWNVLPSVWQHQGKPMLLG